MAVRRIARRGLLWTEHPAPSTAASSSSARHLSSSIHFPPTRADTANHNRESLSRQAASGWAAISKAGQALFTPPANKERGEVELSGAALDLVNELKRPRRDPHRVWSLFQQVDLQGETHTLPLISLHALLSAIHLKPKTSRARPLSLQASSAAARAYAVKVDLIRSRLRQAGGATTPGDWHALLAQYRALQYAPGVSQVWGEMVDAGFPPKVSMARAVLETYLGWIGMHGRASGRAVERATAEPLMRKAVVVLGELQRGGKKVNDLVELLLKIAIKAGDVQVFAKAVKEFYAFDVKLPGAAVEASERAQVEALPVGEQEVCLMLDAFAEKDDLPAMVAIFETFDHPAPSSASNSDFFTQSFSSLSVSDSPSASSSSSDSSTLPSPVPHPIGTRAFTTLIQTAARLGNGPLTRHYFDLLFKRWEAGAEERLSELELAVGISPEALETKVAQAQREGREEAQVAQDEGQESGFVETVREAGASRSHSIVSIHGAHLTAAPAQPATPYTLPSTIIASVAHGSFTHYDAATARWLRLRTRRILQLMDQQTARLSSVVDRLEPSSSSPSADPSADSSAAAAPASPSSPSAALVALQRELALSTFHLTQLRLTLSSVKHDSNIVTAHKHLHALQSELSYRSKRVSSPSTSKKEQLRSRPALRRKEKQVLLHQMLVIRHRLNKLREIERQGFGSPEFDEYLAQYRVLRSKVEGTGWTEQGPGGEVLGQVPHVAGLEQHVEQQRA
ncbi:hypothetical protein JCM6882_004197 [Rhodosporidiobolus microsporus]